MRPEGQVSRGWGGGELWLSETELRSKFASGRSSLQTHERESAGMLPRKIFKFNPSEMAGQKCI